MEGILNILGKNRDLTNENEIINKQNNFLQSSIGKTVNAGLDLGLRAILPNLIEDEVIGVKNAIISDGFSEGLNKAISSAINFGKSALGIFTGNFENVSQVQSAIKNGGIIDSVSNLISFGIDKARENGLISYNMANTIKRGKNVILNNVSNNIENEFNKQIDSMEKLQKYSNNWITYFNNKDFDGMTREFNKMQEKLKELIPFENTLKDARVIENLHTLIKNNGQDFNLTDEQLKLANMLT